MSKMANVGVVTGKKYLGKRVLDISGIVDSFDAQEGEVQQIIGKTGQGKTYEATRRALGYLKRGYTVYTTWQLILPDYYDERENKEKLFFSLFFNKKTFCRFNLKKNWGFIDIERPDLEEHIASLTDCIVMLDEGQDIFDARERTQKTGRKTITRTRHMHKTLIIISQRAQAVDVTARANVTYFYKCVKTLAWFWPFKTYFKVYRTEEMDNNNYPIWEEHLSGWKAELWHSGFATNEVFDAYNSWYLRAGIPRSQTIDLEAYELNWMQRFTSLFQKKEEQEVSTEIFERVKENNKKKYATDTLDERKSDIIETMYKGDKKSKK